MSEDAQAILLLSGHLGGDRQFEPLTLGEYNRVARWLRTAQLRPADLLDPRHAPILASATGLAETRLRMLLDRGMQLALAVERWNQAGLWVVGRGDTDYPARCKLHLGEQAPPLLFGAGCRSLLAGGGLAVVGSRDVDEESRAFACEVGARCARGGVPVVSGGARGIDAAAMGSALAAGGIVIGVVADTLLRRSVSRDALAGLSERRLLLVSPYHPEAGFSTGNAMARNKLIYAVADYGLVACTSYQKGGTWEGAVEELKRKRGRPIFVRLQGTPPVGNRKLVECGAVPFPELRGEPLTSEWLEQAAAARTVQPTAVEMSLLPDLVPSQSAADGVREPSSAFDERPLAAETPAVAVPTTVYEAVLPVILASLNEPASSMQLAESLEVTKKQMDVWLKRAVAEGAICKLTRPVRYARKDAEDADAGQ